MRPHTDAGFGALSDERGAYLPAERPSAASSAARLAATQQQRCRASTAPASQRRPRHPPSRARQGATVDARRLKAPRASHCSFFPPTHPACAGEFLGCAAASMSSATHAQRRLSTSNGGPSRPGEASPAGSSCTRAPTAATAARASTAAAAAAAGTTGARPGRAENFSSARRSGGGHSMSSRLLSGRRRGCWGAWQAWRALRRQNTFELAFFF